MSRHRALLFTLLPLAAACSVSAALPGGLGPLPAATQDGGSSAEDGGSPAPPDDGAVAPPSASDAGDAGPDLSSDPNNCGFTGHVCETTCTGGYCDPVALRTLTANVYFDAIDGDSIYYLVGLTGKSLYAGSVTSSSGDAVIATVPTAPQDSNTGAFFTSKSYIFFQTFTGGVTVNKSSHKVATFTFATNGAAFGTIVGNDTGVYWFDDSGLLWSVPMTGGTPKQDDSWTISALAADESGIYFYGGPQGGDTTGVWMVSGSTSTQLADNVATTWSLQIGAKNVYGVAPSGTTSDCAQASTLWRVPKTGSSGGAGNVTAVYKAKDYVDPFQADDTSIVWVPCDGASLMNLASSGGKAHALVASNANSPQIDGNYVYFWRAAGTSTTESQLLRVTR